VKRPRRRIQLRLVVCSFIIAAGAIIAFVGVQRGLTGTARDNLPALIESVSPEPNATTVPNQSRIFVDLQSGYIGVLVIDGLELKTLTQTDLQANLPLGQQVGQPLSTVYEEGNATLTFQPVKGAPIESLTEGSHTVVVVYWKLIDGRGVADRSFSWTFTVF
jgi:hypothetical protein